MQLLRAAHPEPSLVVTLVMAGLAISVGLRGGLLVALVAATALGQVSIGWSNDWIDATRGTDAGRRDKPLEQGGLAVSTVRIAALIAAGGTIAISVLLGPVAGALNVAAVGLGWAYNAGLKATPLSILPYLLSFAALPALATFAADIGRPEWWALLAAAGFGGGVHLANALPDIEQDLAVGVRGLPQRLGPTGSLAGSVALLGLGAAAALLGPEGSGTSAVVGMLVVTGLLGGVVVLARAGRRTTAYQLTMLIGLLVVALLIARGSQLAV